jgi:hypothetical protein
MILALILVVMAGCSTVFDVGPVGAQSRIYETRGVESGVESPLHPMLKGQVFENEGQFICTALTLLGPMLVKTDEEREVLRKMSPRVVSVYEQIALDAEVDGLPSALPYCMSGKVAGGLHCFLHVPEDNAKRPAPLLIFLHGGIGNYKFYFYHLLKQARGAGYIVACPTLAGGRWWSDTGRAIFKTTIDRITAEYRVDGDRIFLAGISDGAKGAWTLAAEAESLLVNHRLGGLVTIAGTPPAGLPDASLGTLPTLFFMGTEEQYFSIDRARKVVESLKARECEITWVEFENEDHFFLLRRAGEVFPRIFEWMGRLTASCAAAD